MFNFTIVKKILLLQILGGISLTIYLFLGYVFTNDTVNTIENIKTQKLPESIILTDNVYLLEDISMYFSDVAITGDEELLYEAQKKKKTIIENLNKLSISKYIETIKEFEFYYKYATNITIALAHEEEITLNQITKVQALYFNISEKFKKNNINSRKKLVSSLEDISEDSSSFFTTAITVALSSFVIILIYGSVVLVTVKKQFKNIIDSVKNLANNKPDFSQRLKIKNNDEIAILSKWFNMLQEKLEIDYIKLSKLVEEVRDIHKRTQDSINYASLIQSAIIPDSKLFGNYYNDYFAIWEPKDVVGGDIYLFDELRNEDECLLMVIDCTGHGVPGAFVSMLVKAIELSIVTEIKNSTKVIDTSEILSIFNRKMKELLNQEEKSSISNAGFDGQILYYNKKEKIIKFASARNELFYIQNNEINVIKGDRHSVGYKDSDLNYKFTEHVIDVSDETHLYISSDGYWDQLGGHKELSFGKKRLKAMLEKIKDNPMDEQKEEFMNALHEYQGDMDRQDDITVIGLKV